MWCGELVEVVAVTAKHDPAMEVESLCRALCRFESGLVASFDALLTTIPGTRVPRFQLTGTTGEIVIDGAEVRLYDGTGGDGTVVGPERLPRQLPGRMARLRRRRARRTPLAASPEYGLGELRAALAMYRSAASRRWEPV
jgi:predicted dehydrogenase